MLADLLPESIQINIFGISLGNQSSIHFQRSSNVFVDLFQGGTGQDGFEVSGFADGFNQSQVLFDGERSHKEMSNFDFPNKFLRGLVTEFFFSTANKV